MTILQEYIYIERWDKVFELTSKDNSLINEIDPFELAFKVFQYALVDKGKEEYYYDYSSYDDLKKTVFFCKQFGLKPKTIPQAAAFQDIDSIKALLADGHDIDERDFGERTGLIISALLDWIFRSN